MVTYKKQSQQEIKQQDKDGSKFGCVGGGDAPPKMLRLHYTETDSSLET